MGHLLILMQIKVHYNQNIFTVLEIQILQYLTYKIMFTKFWDIGKNYKRAGFERILYNFVVNLVGSNSLRYTVRSQF